MILRSARGDTKVVTNEKGEASHKMLVGEVVKLVKHKRIPSKRVISSLTYNFVIILKNF